MKKWYETCNNTQLDDIGIVGEKGNTSLLAFSLDHVDERVQRPKQEKKTGDMDAIRDSMDIHNEKDI